MSDQTILIEIKPHLKKYLVKVYGPEPIRFPHGHDYNKLIVRTLNKPPKDYVPLFDRDNSVEIVLPYNNLKDVRCYNYLSLESKIKFRKEVDSDFMFDYKKYIEQKMRDENLNRKDATILCMKMYEISESDITFDAFYKNFYRKMLARTACFSFSIF